MRCDQICSNYYYCHSNTVPGMPRNLNATVNGPQSISLMWMEPESIKGMLLMYIVTTRSGEDVINITNVSSTAFTVESSLNPFVLYTFEVVAVTGAGSGPGAKLNVTTDSSGITITYNSKSGILLYIADT